MQVITEWIAAFSAFDVHSIRDSPGVFPEYLLHASGWLMRANTCNGYASMVGIADDGIADVCARLHLKPA